VIEMAAVVTTPPATTSRTDAEMLVLAMLSYRAYHDLGRGRLELGHLRAAVEDGLRHLPPVRGKWELVWGPAAYRAPFTVFDENVMYVVRAIEATDRYAVVVRGTNPVSAFDWLFGDLWTGVLTPWPFPSEAPDAPGVPDAAVSLSTALGLAILSHLRSAGREGAAYAAVWRLLDETVGDPARGAARAVLDPLGPMVGGALRRLRLDLRADLRELRRRRELRTVTSLEDRVAGMLADRYSEPAQRLLSALHAALEAGGERPHRELLRLMEGSLRLRTRLAAGSTLAEFLRSALGRAEAPVEVWVTGHSKGGALAPALALALAQNQGPGAAPGWAWDPGRRATVRCWAFAGPTPGDRAFAGLTDRVLGARCRRIANRLDVVPHAWAVRPGPAAEGLYLDDAAHLYGPEVDRLPGLERLAQLLAADVRALDYAHTTANVVVLDGRVDPNRPGFGEQLAYQHMEAYLEQLGLAGEVDLAGFFGV
jgi:hypothetical protein